MSWKLAAFTFDPYALTAVKKEEEEAPECSSGDACKPSAAQPAAAECFKKRKPGRQPNASVNCQVRERRRRCASGRAPGQQGA